MRAIDSGKINSFKQSWALVLIVSLLFILSLLYSTTAYSTEKPQTSQTFQHGKNPEIQQIKPKKPVKIKLKRSSKGEYSWDLSGDSVDDIVKADKRLRKSLQIE